MAKTQNAPETADYICIDTAYYAPVEGGKPRLYTPGQKMTTARKNVPTHVFKAKPGAKKKPTSAKAETEKKEPTDIG